VGRRAPGTIGRWRGAAGSQETPHESLETHPTVAHGQNPEDHTVPLLTQQRPLLVLELAEDADAQNKDDHTEQNSSRNDSSRLVQDGDQLCPGHDEDGEHSSSVGQPISISQLHVSKQSNQHHDKAAYCLFQGK